MDEKIYNKKFHANREANTRKSAANILKIVLDTYDVKSVCDVGGGIGVWDKEYISQRGNAEHDVLLLDGDYIKPDDLVISPELFMVTDLECPFEIARRFDLAISLECAEHLQPERAEGFVRDLTKLSDVVLFSAATFKQGGNGHLNEKPASFWKEIFEKFGYIAFDVIRPNVQHDRDVLSWYKNNVLVYVKKGSPYVENFASIDCPPVIDYIVPDLYIPKAKELERIHGSVWGKLWKIQWKIMVIGYNILKRFGLLPAKYR